MGYLSNGIPLQRGIQIVASSSIASSVSSGTAETQLASIAIPAMLMGLNGKLRITTMWSYTNSANNKTLRVRFGGSGGTTYLATTFTTTTNARLQQEIGNINSASSQKGWASSGSFGSTSSAASVQTSSIDTTAATTLYISGQTASSGETITLESYLVEFIPGV